MIQDQHEHLTTAQLSAYLDQELAPDEIALCATHMQTCQRCQTALADLRFTSALLHSIPQVEVPRSFVLPTNLVVLPTTPAGVSEAPHLRRYTFVKRTLRTLSTIAAVIGLLLILAGALTTIPHNINTSTAALPAPPANTGHVAAQGSSTVSRLQTPLATPDKRTEPTTLTRTPEQTFTPQATPGNGTTTTSTPNSTSNGPPGPPLTLDPTQPAGRLSLGAVLLLLGILGLLWTRRLQRATR